MGVSGREQSGQQVSREDVAATLAARQELGADFEPALVESMAQRLESVIEARVEARLAQRPPAATPAPPPAAQAMAAPQAMTPKMRLGLAVTSLVMAFPITGVAADFTGLAGVVVVWSGIVLVNVAAGFSPRAQR